MYDRFSIILFLGSPVYDESGDLVCTKAFPCMPIYFWNDADGRKYHKAYFNKFPGGIFKASYLKEPT